jgi:putative tributyrin esterase
MALFHAHFPSEALGQQTSAEVLLPDRPGDGPLPVLYLLHGLSDDHTIWLRRTSVERYAASLRLAIVMPDGHRSFYTDMHRGERFFTYLAEELPARMRAYFPISVRREDTFVAGLSMGGYGAFKLALHHPDRYAAAASLSGALDMARRVETAFSELLTTVFGSRAALREAPHNLLRTVARMGRSPALRRRCPALYQACGTEDYLYADNQTFRRAAEAAGLPLHYTEGPGAHDWAYWDARIQDVLAWLPRSSASTRTNRPSACSKRPVRPSDRPGSSAQSSKPASAAQSRSARRPRSAS